MRNHRCPSCGYKDKWSNWDVGFRCVLIFAVVIYATITSRSTRLKIEAQEKARQSADEVANT